MAAWRYRALAGREMISGVADGANAGEIAALLQRRGLIVLAIGPAARRFALWNLQLRGRGLSRSELTELTRELAALLGAGQDLDRALRFMIEGAANRRVAGVLTGVRDRLRDGASLAFALGSAKASFPRLYIGLVRAGEAGGALPATLESIAELLERSRRLNATIQAAMIYPAILVVAATGAIVLLLTQVLPQFVPLFAQNGVALPAATAALLGIGNALSRYGLFGITLLLAAGLGIANFLRRPAPRRAAERALLALPVIGPLLRDVIAARFARTMGMLLDNGVGLLAALAITRDVMGHALAEDTVAAAALSAKNGGGLAPALAVSPVFPSRLVHLLRLGEETAQLGPMALRAADMHEERTRLAVQRLMAMLVPAITIIMGAAVAGIVSSLLLAMLSLNDIAQ